MPRFEFAAQSARDPDNTGANTARLLNCFLEPVNGRTSNVLKSVLGATLFSQLGSVFLRDLFVMNKNVFAVCGGELFKIAEDGTSESLAPVTDSPDVTISSNNGVLTVVSGGDYYTWDGTTLGTPTGGAFSDFADVTFMDQRTILLEKDGRRVQWSDLVDPDTLDALNFATTETRDDNNLRAFPINGLLWIFKERSIERWQGTGVGFAYQPGSTVDVGLAGRNLITDMPNGAFFVGSDGRVYLVQGGGISPISNPAIESAINLGTATSVFRTTDEGHEFCVIRFSDRPAWCYNIATGLWNERMTGDGDAWEVVQCVEAFGANICGNDLGEIFALERSNIDNGGPMIRRAVSRILDFEGQRFKLKKLEIRARVGWSEFAQSIPTVLDAGSGLAIDGGDGFALVFGNVIGEIPYLELRVSKDYGQTFGPPKRRSLGDYGEFSARTVWRSLGQCRSAVIEVSWSSQAEIPIDAVAFAEVA